MSAEQRETYDLYERLNRLAYQRAATLVRARQTPMDFMTDDRYARLARITERAYQRAARAQEQGR